MDNIKLRDCARVCEVFEARKPNLFLFGHIHHPISGVFQGIPFHTQRAFNHQVALNFKQSPIEAYTEENPDIAIVRPIAEGMAVFAKSVDGEVRQFLAGDKTL